MRTRSLLIFVAFCLRASSLFAEESAETKDTAAKAKVLQEVRERIVWYDDAKTDPMLIPEDVFGMLPYQDLPIPEDDRQPIRMWLSFRRDWVSRFGERYPECTYPQFFKRREVPPEEKKTLEELVARGPVALLVTVDRITEAFWPNQGIYQYNEVSVLEVLTDADDDHGDARSTRAFLSPGGEIVVDGTRLCTLSPWHEAAPRPKEQYLLIGTAGDKDIFSPNYYFRVENDAVVPANYSALKMPGKPKPISEITPDRPM